MATKRDSIVRNGENGFFGLFLFGGMCWVCRLVVEASMLPVRILPMEAS